MTKVGLDLRDKVNQRLNFSYNENLATEIAIIGAGVSGLYSGFRLLNAPGSQLEGKDVQIFELGNRIGGRLESIVLPGSDVVGELGGMRYLHSQRIVTTLIEKIFAPEMTSLEFPMGSNRDQLLMYLRKQRIKQSDWEKSQSKGEKLKTNYQLNSKDIGLNADQLFNKIIFDVMVSDPWFNEHPTLRKKVIKLSEYEYHFKLKSNEWDEVKPMLTYCFTGSPYFGRKVNELGFWNLIKDQASEEGYNFLADAGGYYSNTINWNAAEAFPYMVGDFAGKVKYKTIKQGYDCIAFALANSYLSFSGSAIWAGNRLITFTKTRNASYRYELKFKNQSSQKEWVVRANKIILAMPRRSLELLDQNNFFFNQPTLQKNITSTILEPSYKLLMGFEHPWWKRIHISAGHSITDLPLRQCYYFGVDKENDHALLLASYGDMSSESFWKALSDDTEPFVSKATPRATNEELSRFNDNRASKVMVQEAVAQLRELHGPDVNIPEPYIALFKDWSVDPFGGGYHAWKAGYSIQHVMEFMRKPLPEEDIHICGEAYSDQQGWVEGAFCVAEKMLQQYFGLAWPTWLGPADNKDPNHYYLGW